MYPGMYDPPGGKRNHKGPLQGTLSQEEILVVAVNMKISQNDFFHHPYSCLRKRFLKTC